MRKTNEQFSKEVFNLVGNEYTFLEKYNGATSKIKVKHNCDDCNNNEYEVRPNDFISGGKRCPKCAGRGATKSSFMKRVHEKHGTDSYELISDFVNMTTKITLKHRCGNNITNLPNVFLRDSEYCKHCSAKKLSKKYEMDISVIVEFVNNENYKLISQKYVKSDKLIFECSHGHEFPMMWNAFQQGKRCPKCKAIESSERQKMPIEDVLKLIDSIDCEMVEFPNGYENRNSQITIRCENGHYSTKSVASIQAGNGCPHCKKPSKSEVKIREYLISNNIKFESQFKYDDCINSRRLPFDFAILDDSGDVKFLIEYDGEQHFKPISKFGGEEGFRKTVCNDNIKNNYCKENNIKLYRITYKNKKQIEKILDAIFK